jgi:hypothetical protein
MMKIFYSTPCQYSDSVAGSWVAINKDYPSQITSTRNDRRKKEKKTATQQSDGWLTVHASTRPLMLNSHKSFCRNHSP